MFNWVYILRCQNQSLYTGSTTDPDRRFLQHCNGTGAKYTKAFKPIDMVALWKIEGPLGEAMKIEAAIKKLTKTDKELLINDHNKNKNMLNLYDYQRDIASHLC